MNFVSISFVLLLFIFNVESDCRYRNLNLPKGIFKYWASWGCYIYTRPDFFNGAPIELKKCSLHIKESNYLVPGIKHGSFCHPFHYTSKTVVYKVAESFLSNKTLSRWIECTEVAEDCCDNVMDSDRAVDFRGRCPSVWDGWSCFRSIPAGEVYQLPCPRFAYGHEPPRCNHYSFKKCYSNGSWNQQTDYTTCDVTPPLIVRNLYFIAVLTISTIVCIPALSVLMFTKAAHSQKLRIIRGLLLAVCIHNVMVILVRAFIIMPELTTTQSTTTAMYRNTIACRCLTVFEKLSGNTVFGCMLLIAIFLHQLLTNLFRIHDRSNSAVMMPFYVCTGIIVVGSAVWWTVTMALYNDQHCWQVSDDDSHADWILDGPRLGMLCVNLILLLHITIRLWHAFNAKESDESPFLRALKAALICLPVFGMQFLFLIIHPDMENCGTEQFYYFTNYSISGAQGIFIAIFHCYTEREVSKYFVECWWNFKKVWRRDSIVSKCSTIDTRLELVDPLEPTKNTLYRPRSISL